MPTVQPERLILASGSPARRELLTRFGYQFDVRPAHVEEPTRGRPWRPAQLRADDRLDEGRGRGGDRR